jgi:ribosomal protein S12 methylthiotransferase
MKIGLVSLGCPKNLVDSEVMLGLAQEAGHELTPRADEADVLIVNTCAFIDKAKQESIDTILELAEHKKTGACRRLVVTGCLAERYRHEIQQLIPEVDVVLGTGEVPEIVNALDDRRADGPSAQALTGSERGVAMPLTLHRKPPTAAPTKVAARHRDAVATRELPTYIYEAETPRALTTPKHFAYIKIAEGCDYNCAFCIIPTLRGQYRSRSVESIVTEARALAARGVKELLLISQDSTFYGIDRQERDALPRLLRALNDVEGIAWVRLLYLYPTTITDAAIEAMAESDKVCRYIDLPLQHAAPTVLRRMRRPGGRESYEKLLARIRERLPEVTLRTTLIVGFPGETEEEFEELCAFVKAVEFDHVGVFTYSHEEGTAAYQLEDDVPAAVKRKRRNKVMSIQKAIVARKQRTRIGQTVELLVDGPSKEHDLVLQARLRGHAPDIDPVVYLTDCDLADFAPGSIVKAEIVDARDYDLVARPVSGLISDEVALTTV